MSEQEDAGGPTMGQVSQVMIDKINGELDKASPPLSNNDRLLIMMLMERVIHKEVEKMLDRGQI